MSTMMPDISFEKEAITKKLELCQIKSTARCNFNGGIVVEVKSVREAIVAQTAGASCVVAAEHFPDGINRMSDPTFILQIKRAVSIPVMARVRVGHLIEAKILESIGVNFIDENELLGVADKRQTITDKKKFNTPFVSSCKDIYQAMRNIKSGVIVLRLQGTGEISDTVEIVKRIGEDVNKLRYLEEHKTLDYAEKFNVPQDIVMLTKRNRRLPAIQMAAGGIMTPADVALMMELGCDGVFVGQEIFDGRDSFGRVLALTNAVKYFKDPKVLSDLSCGFFKPVYKEKDDDHESKNSTEVD